MLDLSLYRLRGFGTVYDHVGLVSFRLQRFLGGLTPGKILLSPTTRHGPSEAQLRRGIHKDNFVAKSVPTRLEQQRHIQHDCYVRLSLLQLANSRLRQLSD